MEKGITFKPENYAPLVLAYMGDAYIELLTRAYIIGDGNCSPAALNTRAKEFVTAVSQSAAVERILPLLTDEELAVYKQGRNAKSNHAPRSASAVDYRRATGLECLFGWLYFSGRHARAKELFEKGYITEK
ncbi:MAG TPA: ribonuclease III domain-containing protein [Bacillota bacterium]|nr:ribonuclease III domain-containing protein [Bacillota bacterium]HOK69214.1 ribonuclease III domain-containing protein [Bacillota bacterium]HPP84667.1 ribonuclease III domain-containing protein [Bacillota bacterium]